MELYALANIQCNICVFMGKHVGSVLDRVENRWPSVKSKRDAFIFTCCNIQLCWSFDAANNVFFSVVLRMNVGKKEEK